MDQPGKNQFWCDIQDLCGGGDTDSNSVRGRWSPFQQGDVFLSACPQAAPGSLSPVNKELSSSGEERPEPQHHQRN